jgi:hypothetical protein
MAFKMHEKVYDSSDFKVNGEKKLYWHSKARVTCNILMV